MSLEADQQSDAWNFYENLRQRSVERSKSGGNSYRTQADYLVDDAQNILDIRSEHGWMALIMEHQNPFSQLKTMEQIFSCSTMKGFEQQSALEKGQMDNGLPAELFKAAKSW